MKPPTLDETGLSMPEAMEGGGPPEEAAGRLAPSASLPPERHALHERFHQMLASDHVLERMITQSVKRRTRKLRNQIATRLLAFYSDRATEQRVQILDHPTVRAALEQLWECATSGGEEKVDRSEYMQLHRKMVLWLQPWVGPSEAQKTAERDWMDDSQGHSFLNKERFCWAWFELADLWTSTMEVKDYCNFLRRALKDLTVELENGRRVWQCDADVLQAHYRKARNVPLERSEAVVSISWYNVRGAALLRHSSQPHVLFSNPGVQKRRNEACRTTQEGEGGDRSRNREEHGAPHCSGGKLLARVVAIRPFH